MMRYKKLEKVCEHKTKYSLGRKYVVEDNCQTVKKTYIRPDKPGYCKAYFDHNLTTAGDKVRYVGDERNGGRWVDVRLIISVVISSCVRASPFLMSDTLFPCGQLLSAGLFTDQSPFEKRVLMCKKSKRP